MYHKSEFSKKNETGLRNTCGWRRSTVKKLPNWDLKKKTEGPIRRTEELSNEPVDRDLYTDFVISKRSHFES